MASSSLAVLLHRRLVSLMVARSRRVRLAARDLLLVTLLRVPTTPDRRSALVQTPQQPRNVHGRANVLQPTSLSLTLG
jgi:hypothetical protein